jgi:hypothetical protein
MEPAVGSNEGISFEVKNDCRSMGIRVNCLTGDAWLSIYVDPVPLTGTAPYTPVVSLLIWFDLSLQTSTTFTEVVSMNIEVCFRTPHTDTKSVLTYCQVDFTGGATSKTLAYMFPGQAQAPVMAVGSLEMRRRALVSHLEGCTTHFPADSKISRLPKVNASSRASLTSTSPHPSESQTRQPYQTTLCRLWSHMLQTRFSTMLLSSFTSTFPALRKFLSSLVIGRSI